MDISSISQIIGSLGFPVAMCCYLLYYMEKERQSHKEEMDNVTEALNNNTIAINKLYEKLDK